jgi:hypothetical protein
MTATNSSHTLCIHSDLKKAVGFSPLLLDGALDYAITNVIHIICASFTHFIECVKEPNSYVTSLSSMVWLKLTYDVAKTRTFLADFIIRTHLFEVFTASPCL